MILSVAPSESWSTSGTDSTSFQIPGYTLLNENRIFSTGGGVPSALCVRLGYSFSIRYDLKIDSTENPWIETAGVSYKPTNFSKPKFLDKLGRTRQKDLNG